MWINLKLLYRVVVWTLKMEVLKNYESCDAFNCHRVSHTLSTRFLHILLITWLLISTTCTQSSSQSPYEPTHLSQHCVVSSFYTEHLPDYLPVDTYLLRSHLSTASEHLKAIPFTKLLFTTSATDKNRHFTASITILIYHTVTHLVFSKLFWYYLCLHSSVPWQYLWIFMVVPALLCLLLTFIVLIKLLFYITFLQIWQKMYTQLLSCGNYVLDHTWNGVCVPFHVWSNTGERSSTLLFLNLI